MITATIVTISKQSVFAQSKPKPVDTVTLMNGNKIKGKVAGITDDAITFVHQGETLAFAVKKQEINKIKFASGRVETINEIKEQDKSGNQANKIPIQRNLVAVLPFTYIGQGGEKDEKLSKKVQSDCYNLLLKNASRFSIQDPMQTNALLARQGVNESNIESCTPGELAYILGAEYVVAGSVLVDHKGTTNSESGGSTTNSQRNKDGSKRTTFSSGSSTTREQYKTQVDLKVYVDDGRNISSESKTSLWEGEDAYKATLKYLVKRCPLYSK
ncbi:hypothetical protein [Arcticibacter tournemirensis]|nr:hypothetical protein [Arcticibacter tournemirensis]